jgi:hypothetical protein
MQLSPFTPAGWLLGQLQARLDRVRRKSDRGASTAEWVIIAAVLVAIAATVGVIIYNFVIGPPEPPPQPPIPGRL